MEQQQQQDETSLQRPTPLPASLVNKKKTAEDAVDDLERRLQMLGGGSSDHVAAPALTASASGTSTTTNASTSSSMAAPPAAATPAPATPAIPIMGAPGGKNALLARIKAAQDRAKHPPSSTTSSFPAAATAPPQPVPPAFDSFAPSMMSAPPSTFSSAAVSRPAPSMSFDPFAAPSSNNNSSSSSVTAPITHNNDAMFFAPSSSAPAAFDDLLGNQHPQVAPQQQQQQEEESLESILAALEGLSEEEKQAILAEQGKIMASIEKTKVSSADARANAFEQRSLAGALRAPVAVNNMDASSMAAAGLTAEETEQMKADMELAEQLQREEYDQAEREDSERAERRRRTQQHSSSSSPSSPNRAAAATHEPGWMEWLGLAAAPAPAPPAHLAPRRPLQRGEIGVSLPPGSSISRASGGGSGSPVRTGAGARAGTETITFTPSYDDADRGGEDAAFLRSHRGSTPAARVAERQPLFSCVADSITSAATAVSTALQMTEDDEGNVHGVDSSGLLGGGASSPGRDSNNNNESTTPYSRAG